jgi:hypothetical protein
VVKARLCIKKWGAMSPRIVRLLIGNAVIMKEMAKHVSDPGSYALVTILIHERPDGVHLSYDSMASVLAPYKNRDALEVAHVHRQNPRTAPKALAASGHTA